MRSPSLTLRLAALLGILAVGGCTGAQATPTPKVTSPGGGAASPTLPAEARNLSIVFTTPGFSAVPFLEAIDVLRQEGYTIDTPSLDTSELTVEGVANGEFQFSTGTSSAILAAVSKGANLKILSDRVSNEWTLWGVPDVTTCEDLDERRTGIGSQGAVSTAMLTSFVDATCPGTEPVYMPLGQSPDRNAAFVAGQIDANLMELSDAIRFEAQYPDRFVQITSFSETLPDLHPAPLYGNGDFLAKYPQVASDLVRAQLMVHHRIADEPGYLRSLVEKHIPELVDDQLDPIIDRYVELDMFPVDGGLTKEAVQYTITFFEDAGVVDAGLTVDKVADLTYLEAER